MRIRQRIVNLLQYIPPVLKALWLFLPGILFLLLAVFAFWHMGQGKDIIRQSLEQRGAGTVVVLAVIFWVFVTWYTARLVAYNHDELYRTQVTSVNGRRIAIGKKLLYHGPRLVSFGIFAVLTIAFLQYDRAVPLSNGIVWSLLTIEFALYLLLHRAFVRFESQNMQHNTPGLIRYRNAVRALLAAACVTIIATWGHMLTLVAMTALLQFGFLFLVIVRRPIAKWKGATHPSRQPHFLDPYLNAVFGTDRLQKNASLRELKEAERGVFLFFNALALVCLVCYLIAIFSLPFARGIGPLAFVFLAFGILLGVGNFIGLLSRRIGTNLFFILIAFVFIVGLWSEPHRVRLTDEAPKNVVAHRPSFIEYLERWLRDSSRYARLQSDTAAFPVFLVLADGGASRSGYWTALVLSRLTDETKEGATPFYRHLFGLSGASGGSVGNGTYVAALAHKDALLRDSMGFGKTTTGFLGSDFLSFTLARLLGPDLVAPVSHWLFAGDRAWALEKSLERPQGGHLLAHNMEAPFSQFYPPANGSGPLYPLLVFNTTRMQDGNPGVVANFDLDSVAFGNRIDVLDSVAPPYMLRLSTAMILGARFPYISPAGRIRNSYFVDGGYFDNSGAGIVHEMLLEVSRIKRNNLLAGNLQPLLNRLRFYVLHITNSPYGSGTVERVHPFRNDLAAPLLTLAGSYESQTNVNNTRLQNYMKEIYGTGSYIQFNLYKKDSVESFPMNWVISDELRKRMDGRVKTIPELNSLIGRLQRGEGDLLRGLKQQSAPVADSVAAPPRP